MAGLTPGYWPNNYWTHGATGPGYWPDEYWTDYGTDEPPVEEETKVTMDYYHYFFMILSRFQMF
jgi:hypothetical protein